jgi:hypothetical protein
VLIRAAKSVLCGVPRKRSSRAFHLALIAAYSEGWSRALAWNAEASSSSFCTSGSSDGVLAASETGGGGSFLPPETMTMASTIVTRAPAAAPPRIILFLRASPEPEASGDRTPMILSIAPRSSS